MKKIEENGSVYYAFEDKDYAVQKQFEEVMGSAEVNDAFVNTLIDAMGKMRRQRNEGWKQIYKLCDIGSEDVQNMTYEWLLGRFKVYPKIKVGEGK